jgi:hypothetical protein
MKIAPWVACEDLYDANFKHNEHSWSTDFQREVHVLVVADFKAESKIQAAKNALLSASTISLAKKYQVAAPTIRLASTVGSWRQLQVNLGKFPGTFLEAPDYVDDVIGVLKKKGARTHHVHPY